MSELLRFWDKDINKLSNEELHDEERVQKYLRTTLKLRVNMLKKKDATSQYSSVRLNQIDFLDMYIHELDGLIAELEDRKTIKTKKNERSVRYAMRKRDEAYLASDGIGISWDKDKFMILARDRGYLSEQSITAAISKELNLALDRTKTLLKHGKFTWGQVMCIGALLKMNPKEFCDIFLSGYFTEYYGEYIASYKNLDKSVLLKRATT